MQKEASVSQKNNISTSSYVPKIVKTVWNFYFNTVWYLLFTLPMMIVRSVAQLLIDRAHFVSRHSLKVVSWNIQIVNDIKTQIVNKLPQGYMFMRVIDIAFLPVLLALSIFKGILDHSEALLKEKSSKSPDAEKNTLNKVVKKAVKQTEEDLFKQQKEAEKKKMQIEEETKKKDEEKKKQEDKKRQEELEKARKHEEQLEQELKQKQEEELKKEQELNTKKWENLALKLEVEKLEKEKAEKEKRDAQQKKKEAIEKRQHEVEEEKKRKVEEERIRHEEQERIKKEHAKQKKQEKKQHKKEQKEHDEELRKKQMEEALALEQEKQLEDRAREEKVIQELAERQAQLELELEQERLEQERILLIEAQHVEEQLLKQQGRQETILVTEVAAKTDNILKQKMAEMSALAAQSRTKEYLARQARDKADEELALKNKPSFGDLVSRLSNNDENTQVADFFNYHMTNSELKQVVEALQDNNVVLELNLRGNTLIDDEAAADLANLVDGSESLLRIDLAGLSVTNFEPLLQKLKDNNVITHLDLPAEAEDDVVDRVEAILKRNNVQKNKNLAKALQQAE